MARVQKTKNNNNMENIQRRTTTLQNKSQTAYNEKVIFREKVEYILEKYSQIKLFPEKLIERGSP